MFKIFLGGIYAVSKKPRLRYHNRAVILIQHITNYTAEITLRFNFRGSKFPGGECPRLPLVAKACLSHYK